MREGIFQKKVIDELKTRFNGCVVIKNDPNYIQGFPDLLVLYKDKWAALECKRGTKAKRQPNQEYHNDILDKMSFSRFICPENKEEVFNELQQSFVS